MVRRKDIERELKKFKKSLSKRIEIEKIIFFGSLAKGKGHKYSDVDLIIISPEFRGKEFRDRPLGFYKYWNLDLPFDFLCYTPEEFKKLSKMITIVREAVKEGIEIS